MCTKSLKNFESNKKICYRSHAFFRKKSRKVRFFRNHGPQLLRGKIFSKSFKYVQKPCANVSYIHEEATPQISAKSDFSTILSCNFSTKSQKKLHQIPKSSYLQMAFCLKIYRQKSKKQ